MKNVETKMTVKQAKAEIEFCHSFFDSVTLDTSDELIDKYVARCKAARAIIAADETKAEEEPEMTTTTKENATKKLYKVWTYNPDDEVIQESAARLDIINGCGYYGNRVNVSMKVNRKTLKGAYGYFQKAIAQAVEDGVLDAKVAEFSTYADDVATIQSMFGDKDYFAEYDNVDNSFAYGIDDNGEGLGYYFWFWVKIDETKEEETKMTNETKIANELPKGEITTDSVKAAELIAAYFPNGLHFCGASKGYNKEDVFTFTDDKEKFYAIMYSTPDNSRIELIEVIKSYESGSKRRPFTVIIDNTTAEEVTIETDGSEDDTDDQNDVFKYLPAIESLNDVDTNQTKDEMKAAADQMGLMQLNRKIADLEEQLIDNRLAATAVLNEITDDTTFAEQKEIERRYFEHAAISDALIDEKDIYKAAKFTRLSQIAAIKNLMRKNQNTSSTKEPPALDIDDKEFFNTQAAFIDATIQRNLAERDLHTAKDKFAAAEPVDEFTAELERLKAAYDKATGELDKADNELFKAREVAKELERKAIAAEDVRFKAKCAYPNFISDKAEELTAELITPEVFNSDAMVIIKQSGQELKRSTLFALRISNHGKGWEIAKGMVLFGRYDTPAQVEQVIAMLKAAIERGDTEFTFPTIEQLNTPTNSTDAEISDSLTRAMQTAEYNVQTYRRHNNPDGMRYEMELYSICADALNELKRRVA